MKLYCIGIGPGGEGADDAARSACSGKNVTAWQATACTLI